MFELIAREVGAELSRGGRAKVALIQAGMEEFGMRGLEGARTRTIVKKAGQNLGSINYHFGGKEGLYRAIAEVMTAVMRQRLDPIFAKVDRALVDWEGHDEEIMEEVMELLMEIMEPVMEALVADDRLASMSLIIMREQIQPTATFDIYYERVMRPLHERLTRLISRATGREPESEAAIGEAHSLIGQVIIFRNGRETLKRRAGWEAVGERQREVIFGAIRRSIRAQVTGLSSLTERKEN